MLYYVFIYTTVDNFKNKWILIITLKNIDTEKLF